METLNQIQAVIFDLDGTLIDTEKIYHITWPRAIADMGHTLTEEQFLSMRSLGRPYAPARMKEWFGEDFDYVKAREIRKGYFNAFVKEHGIDRKPGAIELLTYLREKKIVTAIATATDPERAQAYLDMTGLNGYFDKIISATMVDEGKPSPKVYQYACRELGLAPENCIAVEDAPNGVVSASDAGCMVIMVPDLSQPDEALRKRLFACVESLDRIMDLI